MTKGGVAGVCGNMGRGAKISMLPAANFPLPRPSTVPRSPLPRHVTPMRALGRGVSFVHALEFGIEHARIPNMLTAGNGE